MVKKCMLCGALFDKKLGASFHRFPKEFNSRRRWLRACRATEKMLVSSSCICSRHFDSDDFDNSYWPKRRLLPSAVPSIPSTWIPPYTAMGDDEVISLSSPTHSNTPVDPLQCFVPTEEYGESTSTVESGFVIPEYLREQIQIIQVFPNSNSRSKSASRSNIVKQEVDDDVEVIEDDCEVETSNFPKQEIKILDVFSEASCNVNSGADSDQDIEIIEDTHHHRSYSTPVMKKISNIQNGGSRKMILTPSTESSHYISTLTVDHFSTPAKAVRNLQITKATVTNLNDKIKKVKLENHMLLKKMERFKNVLLYLRNNNLILENRAINMVNKLL